MAGGLVPLCEGHLAEAAALVAAKFGAERASIPALPVRYEDRSEILCLLKEIALKEEGVAVERKGRLAGFMVATALPDFRGWRAAWSPEWANAASGGGEAALYRIMYERLASRWVADGRLCHLVSVFSGDGPGMEALRWLGFGMVAMDAVRDLSPVKGNATPLEIRRAGPADLELSMELSAKLAEYMRRSPIYLHVPVRQDPAEHAGWLADPSNALFVGSLNGEIAGFMRLIPSNPNASYLIRDPGTLSVSGAWVKEEFRGRGIGSALLLHCINFARDAACRRCSVDFEPENAKGRGFWLGHFREFSRTYARYIDKRFMPGGS